MDPLRELTRTRGFFTRQDAKDAGYDDSRIAGMVRHRLWIRFRRGFYAFADEWQSLDPVARHRVRSRAVLYSLGPGVALSHASGAIEHGIDVWGVPLDKVHVTRLDGGAGRVEGDVVHHEGIALDRDVHETDAGLVLAPSRCTLEGASRATDEAALCLFDSGLRAGAFTYDDLRTRHEAMQHWPFMRHLQVPIRMADGRSGSVGESRGKWHFWAMGLPCPVLQFEVVGPDGEIIAVCDWGWPEYGLLGEFDGKVKYDRLLRPEQTPGDAVFAEKQREDAVREATGYRMIRIIWGDYERPGQLRGRLVRMFDIAG